ncbi:MAG: hypothetical protein WC608_04695 [Parcubacteria group bacterium]
MNGKISKQITYWLGVVSVGLILGLSIQFVKAAWTNPTLDPPDGNVGAPINTSDLIQHKSGVLSMDSVGTAFLVPNGNVGIGTVDPDTFALNIQRTGSSSDDDDLLSISSNRETRFNIDSASNTPLLNPLIATTRSRGTQSSPGKVLENDSLFELFVMGHDGTNTTDAGAMLFYADADSASGVTPGRIEFKTSEFGDTDPQTKMTIKSNGNVGIGTTDPQYALDIQRTDPALDKILNISSNRETEFKIVSASDMSMLNPIIVSDRSRGTLAAPSPVQDNDTLLELWAEGYNPNNRFDVGGRITINADGNPSGDSVPGKINFATTTPGTSYFAGTAPTTRMTIDSGGRVLVGEFGSSPASSFDTGSGPNAMTLSGNNRDLALVSSSSGSTDKADIEFFRSLGTPSAPANVAADTRLGQINFHGYYNGWGGAAGRMVTVAALMDGTPSVTSLPTQLQFMVTPAGSTTPGSAVAMTIKNDGKVGIGTTTPQGALDVASTTGALIVPRMTTAQRDALAPVNGMIIYNATTNQFNFRENGAWVLK